MAPLQPFHGKYNVTQVHLQQYFGAIKYDYLLWYGALHRELLNWKKRLHLPKWHHLPKWLQGGAIVTPLFFSV